MVGERVVLPGEPEVCGNYMPAHLTTAIQQVVAHGIVVEGGDLKPASRGRILLGQRSVGATARFSRRTFTHLGLAVSSSETEVKPKDLVASSVLSPSLRRG